MSFHPNDVARRGRTASFIAAGIVAFLLAAFFRTQVLDRARYTLQSEENRLREVPLPAPRGIIYDRNGRIIAENVPGYSVSILSPSADSLREAMRRLAGTIQLTPYEIELAVRRYRRAPNRPTVILSDAKFDVVSVLEEHRVEFPGLIIQAAPKRFYPDSTMVASIVGYTGEVTEDELKKPAYEGYKAGQQIGKGGLERYYESQLRGREGVRFVEVDARGRVVREAGARQDIEPLAAEPLQTMQEYTAQLFGDSLQGGVVAIDPKTGGVLTLYSAPSFNPNRFVGGIPADYWKELTTDPRHPLYNKAIQGTLEAGHRRGRARERDREDGRPDAAAVHRRLSVLQSLLPLLGSARSRQREPAAGDREVVRRLLLSARAQDDAREPDRGRRPAVVPRAHGDRPAERGAADLPGRDPVLRRALWSQALEPRGDAQPRHRPG
jgi:penicillin-binding protein 2